MNLQEAHIYLKRKLSDIYETREAAAIADWVMEKLTGLSKIDRLMKKEVVLGDDRQEQLATYVARLLSHRPVQYVLGESHFYGLTFFVDENVLIPRPETEELVEWILADNSSRHASVLDIGTGSGCIAIALKTKRNGFEVSACDVSDGAIAVAKKNAAINKADVNFLLCDILDPLKSSALGNFDIIVSNPPYIPPSGKLTMSANVLDFEPHSALFTPEEDPYLFYRTIGLFAMKHLRVNGRLYFEIHEEGAAGVTSILEQQGYKNIMVRKDLYGRPRMIAAVVEK